MTTQTILDDKRPIRAIFLHNDSDTQYVVGAYGTTKIEAYGEPCEHWLVPWIAVYYEGKLAYRLPASMVEIVYELEL